MSDSLADVSDSLADVEALARNRYRQAFIVAPGFLSPAALSLHRKALGFARFARKAADARAANANRIARNARPIDQGQPGSIAEAMRSWRTSWRSASSTT